MSNTRKRGHGRVDTPSPATERVTAPPRQRKGFVVDDPPPPPEREELAAAVADERTAKRAASKLWAPHTDPETVPPGYRIRGVSTLRDADGHVMLSWQKTTREPDDPYETARAISEGLADGGALTSIPVIDAPERANEELLSVYPLGDPHIGLYCWAQECGESFDLDVAVRQYLAVAGLLFKRAPVGSPALIIELGDFYHADDPQYRTSSGRHVVDVDTRYGKVIPTGFGIMTTLIEAALVQHSHVTVWCLRGNHDDRTTLTLRAYLQGRYESNPRVTIDTTPGKFHYLEHGKALIGATHGDGLKGRRGRTLHEIMTIDQRQAWGRTTHAKWYVGHVHHESVDEVGGCVVETYRSLVPKDAWHHASGYRSGRDTRLEIVHAEHGWVERHIVPITEIQAAMEHDAAADRILARAVRS